MKVGVNDELVIYLRGFAYATVIISRITPYKTLSRIEPLIRMGNGYQIGIGIFKVF